MLATPDESTVLPNKKRERYQDAPSSRSLGASAKQQRIPDTPVTLSRAESQVKGSAPSVCGVDIANSDPQQQGTARSLSGVGITLLPNGRPLSRQEVSALAKSRACPSCGMGTLAVRSKLAEEQQVENLYLRCRSCHAKFKPADIC